MKPSAEKWKEILQGFLDRLHWRQKDFVGKSERTLLRTTGHPLYLEKNTVSLYLRKHNPRMPRARERHIELVDFFAIHGQLKNADGANSWILHAGYQLVEREICIIFNTTFTIVFSTPPSPEVLAQVRKLLEKVGADIKLALGDEI